MKTIGLLGGMILESTATIYRLFNVAVKERLRGVHTGKIALGCTEVPLLARPEDSPIPVFNMTGIHARRAVEWALEDLA